jgi:hypothetical protein
LLQLTACLMTETGTGPAEVMGRKSWNLTDLCFLFNHAPDDLGTEAATPDSASFVDGPKQNSTPDSGGRHPCINSSFNPVWNRDGAYMAALANKIGYDPVLLSLLDTFNSQRRQFGAPQAASQENGESGVVSLAPETVNVYRPQKSLSLLCGKPIANRHTQSFGTLHASNPSRQIGAQKPATAASYASLRTAARRKLMAVDA